MPWASRRQHRYATRAASPAALAVIRRTTRGVEIVVSRASLWSRMMLFGTHFAVTAISGLALFCGLCAVGVFGISPPNGTVTGWAVVWCLLAGSVAIVSLCLGLGFFLARPGKLLLTRTKQLFVPYYAGSLWSYKVGGIRTTRVSPTEIALELYLPELTEMRRGHRDQPLFGLFWLKCSVVSDSPEVIDLVEGEIRHHKGERWV